MIYLTIEDARATVDRLGFTIRDQDLFEGCIGRPMATAFGEAAYPDLASKAAALLEAVNRSHPLLDGNKRLSWVATLVFLRSNGRDLVAEVDDAESFVLGVAAGELGLAEAVSWLRSHIVDFG